MITENQKPHIGDILVGLRGKIEDVWQRVDQETFEVNVVSENGIKAADLDELNTTMKRRFDVTKHKEIQGIYMIYVYKTSSLDDGEENNNLFYIGESRKSVYSRLKRHFSKVEKQKIEGAPDRYKPFSNLFDDGVKLEVKILRIKNDDLKYRRLLEEILTLSENPKYIDDLNNNLVKRK